MKNITLLRGRAAAEREMVDECTIVRFLDTYTVDPETLKETQDTETVYSGRCKIQNSDVSVVSDPTGPALQTLQQTAVHIPVSVAGVGEGHEITITAAQLDPQLIGTKYIVKEPFLKTAATAQRLKVVRVI